VRFLAMELVRGEDLAQLLARGPLPVKDALDAARQVAAALEAAHDSGIIHRDLKPANVKRTADGTIKVLDFGLAKALGGAGSPREQSATVTSGGTAAGLIVGTASYMSPEQARGLPVDRRTDIWSFGCLLYEMLSGAKAFDGATVTDVLAAVVTGEPDWDRLPPSTPLAAWRRTRASAFAMQATRACSSRTTRRTRGARAPKRSEGRRGSRSRPPPDSWRSPRAPRAFSGDGAPLRPRSSRKCRSSGSPSPAA
jgi:serine/threonine protein kinase